jgi:hypothetical protein
MLRTGTEVGGYRIEGVLGRGGMGVVYEAIQLSLSRTIALKVLASDLSHDDAFRERFRREARTQAIIEHAHIVPVYEAGEIDEGLYIAMRLIRGSNLKQLIHAGDLDSERSLKILLAVGDALDTAHESDLIHRDIKPQNILVGRRDHAFLADFGLTKGKSDTGYTKTGQLMGTLDYVAPEQVKGQLATSASDIYALTAVTYECLVGRPPFSRPTELATLYAHVSDPPPRPSREKPGLPRAIDDVIVAGLAKNPAERPATAVEMLTALEEALRSKPAPAVGAATTPIPTARPPVEEPTAAQPVPVDALQDTEIVVPMGTPTREDLRRAWSPEEAAAAAAETTPEERRRAREERRREAAAREQREAEERDRRKAAAREEREAEERDRRAADERQQRAAEERERRAAAAAAGEQRAAEERKQRAAAAAAREQRRAAVSQRHESAAAPSAQSAKRAPAHGGRTWLVAAAAGVAVAAVAGLLAGGASRDEPTAAPTASQGTELRAGALALTAPAGWQAAAQPATHGLTFDGEAATARSSAATITAGMTAGTGATLLPAAFRGRLAGGAPQREPVRLGELQAYRYDDLEVEGVDRPVTVYATPTDEGVATVSCSGASARDCATAAAGLTVTGARPLRLGPGAAYAKAVDRPIRRLQRSRAAALRRLSRADTPSGQARAAQQVADAYATAGKALGAAKPTALEAEAHAALAAAVRTARTTWAALATNARANRRAAYSRERQTAARADDRVRAALARLGDLGYRIG